MQRKPIKKIEGNNEGPDPHSLNCLLYDSSIHGVKYMSQRDRPVCERMTWLIMIIASAIGAAYFVHGVMDQYYESPVIVSFQTSQTSIAQIPFPAVTVCNINKFRKSAFMEVLAEAQQLQENTSKPEAAKDTETFKNLNETFVKAMKILRVFDNACQATNSFHVLLNYSINETTTNLKDRGIDPEYDMKITLGEVMNAQEFWTQSQLQQTCSEMIPLCLWEGEPFNCSKDFSPHYTRYGTCCTFNMIPDDLNNSSFIRLVSHGTRNSSSEVLKDWSSFNIDKHMVIEEDDDAENERKYPRRQSKAGQGSGLSFLLNPELDEYYCGGNSAFGFRILAHPPMEAARVRDFGMAVGPGVEAFLNVQAELTRSDSTIKDLSPETRYCFFSNEQPLELFRIYTQNNCLDECIANLVLANCSCIRSDLPIPSEDPNLVFCEGKSLECYENLRAQIAQVAGDADDINSTYCKDCFPTCNRIDYRVQTSTLPLRADPRIWTDHYNKTASWAKEKVSIVHVYFGSDSVYSRMRKKLYGTNDLIANIGGILGLFLGLSIIGIIEPIFYFVKLVWLKIPRLSVE